MASSSASQKNAPRNTGHDASNGSGSNGSGPSDHSHHPTHTHDRLDRQAERVLLELIKKGDERALGKLIDEHRGLAVGMARKFARAGLPLEDLLSEAIVGLLTAARRYDLSSTARFATYARWWVRARIFEYVARNRRAVAATGSRNMRKLRLKLRQVERKLEQEKGRAVSREELADALGLDADEVARARALLLGTDTPVVDTMSSEDTAGYIPVDCDTPEDAVSAREQESLSKEIYGVALSALDPRERKIIEHRILSDDPESLRAVGEELDISRERVRQLEARALGKMRKSTQRFTDAVAAAILV